MNKEQEKFEAKKAVRRGDKFCAPWCGRGCTWAEYSRAVKKADALVKKLNAIGGKWKPRVWENLGWHYQAMARHPESFGRFSITEYDDGSYTVWLESSVHSGKTLRHALKAARAAALIDFSEAQQTFDMVDKVIGGS